MTEIRKITLQFPSLRAFLSECGERISAEGMLLRGEAPPAAGTTVDIEVVVAEGMRLVQAIGEVLWSGGADAGAAGKTAAVRFVDLDDTSRMLIGKIVDQRRREGAEPFRLEEVPGPRQARPRDLTVPAAPPGEPGRGAGDSIFELEQPPTASSADLFPPAGDAAPVPAVEAPAEGRQPAPPVPLLADPDPGPFDLEPQPTAGAQESGSAGLEPEPAVPLPGEPDAASNGGLSELFGGDEPETPPARGHTEAFPASFVDEVEAELEAAEAGGDTDSSYSLADAEELETRLPAPLEDLETAEAATGATIETLEAVPATLPGSEQPVDPQPIVEPEMADPGPIAEPEPVVEAAKPRDAEPVLEDQVEGAAEPELEVQAPLVDEPVPEAEAVPAADVAPETEPEAPAEQDLTPEPEPEPATGAGLAETPPEAARGLAAEHGPETVEIPVLETPPAAPPTSTEPAMSAQEPPPAPTPKMPSPVAASTPPAAAPPPALDDNLLSIPELKETTEAAEAPAAGAEAAALRSSAEALRGTASRSRHVGTWLLIALLIGALAVAGYLLLGLMRGDEAAPDAGPAVTAPAPRPTVPEPQPEPAAATAAVDDAEAAEEPTPEPSAAAEAETAAMVEAAPAEAEIAAVVEAAPAEPDPVAPLTGLDRITWTETDAETVLSLVGDGAIPAEQLELLTLAGDQPRLVIKITGVERAFQPAMLEVGTPHVRRVRTGLQAGGELHIVVDLSGPGISLRDLASRGSRVEVRLGAE